MEEAICKQAAKTFTNRNWHVLRDEEKKLVKMLEEGGYILPNVPTNGFVGKVAKNE